MTCVLLKKNLFLETEVLFKHVIHFCRIRPSLMLSSSLFGRTSLILCSYKAENGQYVAHTSLMATDAYARAFGECTRQTGF